MAEVRHTLHDIYAQIPCTVLIAMPVQSNSVSGGINWLALASPAEMPWHSTLLTGAFDAVVNIEASHCYPDVPRFLSEVRRVLHPGGHFLFADFRDRGQPLADLQRQLEESGLEILFRDDISANVVRGMEKNTVKYQDLIRKLMPRFLRRPAMGFAGVKGSAIYKALESGETVYLCYHLRKPFTPTAIKT